MDRQVLRMGTEMSSGADLFVVCKQCGSEVSPYITECPYCGSRLRRRAPKLPRAGAPKRPRRSSRLTALLRRPGRRRRGGDRRRKPPRSQATAGRSRAHTRRSRWSCSAARPSSWSTPNRSPSGKWRSPGRSTATGGGCSATPSPIRPRAIPAFLIITTVAIFGWLLERRHGPFIVLVVFFGATVTGALAALAVYEFPVVTTANAGALALLAAWALPDLAAARSRSYYEGDLIGATVIAALAARAPVRLHLLADQLAGRRRRPRASGCWSGSRCSCASRRALAEARGAPEAGRGSARAPARRCGRRGSASPPRSRRRAGRRRRSTGSSRCRRRSPGRASVRG